MHANTTDVLAGCPSVASVDEGCRRPHVCGMRTNMLPFVPRLNDEDWKVIAFALCRKGYLTEYPHFLEAAARGRNQL